MILVRRHQLAILRTKKKNCDPENEHLGSFDQNDAVNKYK